MIMPDKLFWIILAAIELVVILLCLLLLLRQHKSAGIHKKPSDKNQSEEVGLVLYQYFGKKWDEVFSHVSYPITDAEKKEIVSLVWSVASITLDCLAVSNNSPNILKRNKDVFNYVRGDSDEVKNLKQFYHDPTTVPHQVIAIYDIMKELGFHGTIIAFGYRLNIE